MNPRTLIFMMVNRWMLDYSACFAEQSSDFESSRHSFGLKRTASLPFLASCKRPIAAIFCNEWHMVQSSSPPSVQRDSQ